MINIISINNNSYELKNFEIKTTIYNKKNILKALILSSQKCNYNKELFFIKEIDGNLIIRNKKKRFIFLKGVKIMKNWKKELEEEKILNGLNGFNDKFSFLSNFYSHKNINIKLPYDAQNGKFYSSNNVETLFQAAKCLKINDIEKILKATTPGQAKRLGKKIELRPDWEIIKTKVMKELIENKFKLNPVLKKQLINIPNDKYIVEMNVWNDKEWGVCSKTLIGNNKLGKILMEVKAELEK